MISAGLVIFDCDGVLVDSERVVNRAESEYFAGLGVDLDPEELRRLFKGKTVSDVAPVIESLTKALPAREWLYEWAMNVALAFVRELQPVEGVARVLDALGSAGVKYCLASQSPQSRVALSLHVTGLAPYFNGRIFTASMVAHPKPAPDLFLLAAEEMGAAPERCIVIEDSTSGVVAAKAAGMRVLAYAADEDAGELQAAGGEVFHHMGDLTSILAT